MTRRMALLLAVTSMVAPVPPASAATNVFQLAGTGTASPGLDGRCSVTQSVSFDGTLLVEGDQTGLHSFHFVGTTVSCDIYENGSVTLSGSINGSLRYARTSAHLSLSGSVSIWGGASSHFGASCAYLPTSTNPTNTFALACVGTSVVANR